MSLRQRRRSAGMLLCVFVAAIGACAQQSGEAVEPSCEERLLASGGAYRHSPGLAVAYGESMAELNPRLAGIVEAVADYQAAHPDYASVTGSPDAFSGDTTLYYSLALTNLTVEPSLATNALVETMEAVAQDEGMGGIHALLSGSRHPASDQGGDPLIVLRDRITEQTAPMFDEIVNLPRADCPPDKPAP